MSVAVELRRMNSGGSARENLMRSDQLRKIFDQMDVNNDGQVSKKELDMQLQKAGLEIPDHVRDVLIERGDTDDDGLISFEEFCKLVDEPDMKQFFQKFFNIPPMTQVKTTAITYYKSFKWIPPPFINLTIILVQIIIHTQENKWQLQPKLEFQPSNKQEAWRYYTYSLIHMDWLHLFGNSFIQLVFGTALEPVHGPRVAFVYVIGVISGSLLHAVMNHGSSLVGASAGASALILAWASDVFLNFNEQRCPMVSLVPVILFIIWQAVMTPGSTSIAAHVSGGITGFLIGFIVLKNIKSLQYERFIVKLAMVLSVLYLVVLLLFNIFNIYT